MQHRVSAEVRIFYTLTALGGIVNLRPGLRSARPDVWEPNG